MSSHFPRISILTRHLLQNKSYSVSRSIIKTAKADRMESRIPKGTSIAISDLYQDREQYDERDRLCPVEAPLFAPDQDVNKKILIHIGDITALKVDAIVNAANRSLLGGGGVDGRIHDVAGPQLLEECRSLNGCRTGSAKITDAYKLPCHNVIHAVGPVYDSSRKEKCAELLASCYKTSLTIAATSNLKTIAFSCLSTGIYGYPSMKAACVALDTVRQLLQSQNGHEIDRVIFCLFLRKDVDVYLDSIPVYFPPPAEELPTITETGRPEHVATEVVSDETAVTATLDPKDKIGDTTDTNATDTKASDDKVAEIKATDTNKVETSSEAMSTKATNTEHESTITTSTEPAIVKATEATAPGMEAASNEKLDKHNVGKQEQKNIPE